MIAFAKTCRLLVGTAALALTAAPAWADGPIAPVDAASEHSQFEQARQDILAMAGNYAVTFDMRETTSWMAGYTPIDPKISGGHEAVRVVEDDGERIVLQHLLVVGLPGGEHVIKHWRQDWQYQPERILIYAGPGRWEWTEVPPAMRRGRWSQTVYQVDDSPRYAGWGAWETVNGVRRWRSNWTTRPLARRDAVRHPIYDRYEGINRHQPTPNGWIHWQDNTKMMTAPDGSGELRPVVQESVLNTYTRAPGFDAGPADRYWAATKGYWAAVRAKWDGVAARDGGIAIAEEAETGTIISGRLLTVADEILAGETSEADAIAQAERLIDRATEPDAQ